MVCENRKSIANEFRSCMAPKIIGCPRVCSFVDWRMAWPCLGIAADISRSLFSWGPLYADGCTDDKCWRSKRCSVLCGTCYRIWDTNFDMKAPLLTDQWQVSMLVTLEDFRVPDCTRFRFIPIHDDLPFNRHIEYCGNGKSPCWLWKGWLPKCGLNMDPQELFNSLLDPSRPKVSSGTCQLGMPDLHKWSN